MHRDVSSWLSTLLLLAVATTAEASTVLAFEENRGQTDDRVLFLSRAPGYRFFLTRSEAVLAPVGDGGALRLRWLGADPGPRAVAEGELPGRVHSYLGNQPARWGTGARLWSRVRLERLWPGIDLVFYGNPRELEHDCPSVVWSTRFGGAGGDGGRAITLAPDSSLWVTGVTGSADFPARGLQIPSPRGGEDVFVARLRPDSRRLVYSAAFGGSGNDEVRDISVDGTGRVYLAGATTSADFPAQSPLQGPSVPDAFAVQMTPADGFVIRLRR